VSPVIELWLAVLTVCCIVLGGLSIYWVKADDALRSWWGRRLFVGTLMIMGVTGLAGACLQAEGLAPLGLVAGFLVVAMLWETPDPFRRPRLQEEHA
jgi:hypothetical protein